MNATGVMARRLTRTATNFRPAGPRPLKNTRPLLIATMVSVALVTAACGSETSTERQGDNFAGAAAPTASLSAGSSGAIAARMASLYKSAMDNEEKSITFVVSESASSKAYEKLAAQFESEYSGLSVKVRKLPFLEMGSVVQSELDAGEPTADVITSTPIALAPLIQAGSLKNVDWAADGVDPARIEKMLLALNDGACVSVAYNKKFVSESDLPDSLDGFADPKWKNKLTTEPSNAYACYGFMALRFGLVPMVELVKKLLGNGYTFSSNYSQQFQSGERPVEVMSVFQHAQLWEDNGVDVGLKVYPGNGVFRSRVAVITGTKAPDLAELFALYTVSPAAQTLLKADPLVKGAFVGDPNDALRKRLEDLSGKSITDTDFFVFESLDNFQARADGARAVSKLVTGG